MTFEEALTAEMESIPDLTGRVYPLRAPESYSPPFLVYVSNEGLPDQTLDGFLLTKEINFEVNVIHSTYSNLKPLTDSVLSTLQSFLLRNIGTGGPFIQEIDYEEPVNLYEPEIELYRCFIRAKVRI